ncbi:acyltransferase family protein [Butyrivibrio sp. VCB2006]|uniref:acyltransferase family protein n=1 Tax=Butyrivibrio sp. VCB2006 TaxID=1280679 RepID=UPI000492BC41|nr:acyltransferase family protein [Butyrivibrio sp. VCB2006]
MFARVSNLYTDISGIYASKLFGGSYILCMYIGMLVGLYYDKVKNMLKLKRNLLGFVCTISMIAIMYIIITKGFFMDKPALLGTDINPPGVTLLLFAVTIMLTLCLWNVGAGTGILFLPLEFIGKHTLYIFLYHILLMTILNRYVDISSSWIKALLYYATMIVVPICIEMLLAQCKKIIVKGYLYRKEC